MFTVKDIHHVSIVVADLERALHFYRDILGMVEIPRSPTMTFDGAWIRAGEAEIHFIQANTAAQEPGDAPNNPPPELDATFARHFCFAIEDVDAVVKTLEAHGIDLVAGPRPRGDGAVQIYCYDPDGHLIEFVKLP